MRDVIAVDVAAPPELIFGLVRDVERWPAILPHYRRVRTLRRTPDGRVLAEYVALRPVVATLGVSISAPIVWRSLSWNDPAALRLHFRHLGGASGGMVVTWRIEPAGIGSRVTVEHELERRLPLGPFVSPAVAAMAADAFPAFVDRLVVRPIATLTLARVKQLSEILAGLSATDRTDGDAASEHPEGA